jgi:multidrug efflux pump subunit AcrB
MSTLFFRQPRLVALALLVIIAAGLSSFMTIGRQEDPSITNLFATITTVYPGADPARVEALVTEPLERRLQEVAEIDVINSNSATGISILNVELRDTLADGAIETVWSEIRDVLADVQSELPQGAFAPDFSNDRTGAFAAISVLVPTNEDTAPAIMNRYAQAMADTLRAVPGTKLVDVFGEPIEEVLVSVDATTLASLGLSIDQLSTVIAQADAKVQAGRVRGIESDFLIEIQGEIDSLGRLSRIPVSTATDGSVTRLADVATLSKTERTPRDAMALVDGKRAVMIGARVSDGLQVDVWTGRIRQALDQFEKRLPASVKHTQIFDQSHYTVDRLQGVAINMLIGVGLVVAVLLLTLGARAAAIVALVLPLVSLASLATLNFMGLSIQQMSVTGLIVALGLLVDAAIVMTDDIGRQLAAGKQAINAVGNAVRRLAGPLFASTVTTALSFMPMVLLPGPAGDFVGSIAISVIVMLFWSLLIALTLTPALAGWFLPRQQDGMSWISTGIRSGALGRIFERSLRWSLRHPFNAVLYALVLPIVGFASFPTLIAQFFPGVDRDQFHIEVELPPGTALARTETLVRKMDESIRQTDGIDQVSWVIGRSAPAFYYNMQANRDQAPGFAQALVKTGSPKQTARLVPLLQQTLSNQYPAARVLVRDLVQGPPVAAPVELRLYSNDIRALRTHGDALRQIMTTVPEITVARTSLGGGAPKLSFKVDEDSAQLAGLNLASIARQLEAGLEGARGGSLVESTESLPVRVRVDNANRADLSFIGNFNLISPQAAQRSSDSYVGIPLSAIAQTSLVPAQSVLVRRNAQRVNTVQGFIQYGVLPQEALRQVVNAIETSGHQLPANVRLELGGDADARADTISNLLAPIGLIVTLSISAVVMTFNSFRLAGIALVAAVLSAGLSILALAIFRYPFGITAVIGVIGSIGVSINAAIIILSALKDDVGARNASVSDMTRVVMNSSRHIVSTTITTFGGFLPLILGGGGFWPPFAMSVAGGVLLSTVVSLYFTPPMFALFYARKPKTEEFGLRSQSGYAPNPVTHSST